MGFLIAAAYATAACGAGDHGKAKPSAAVSCVFLARADGNRYWLGFAGHDCSRAGYTELPLDRYGATFGWAYDAAYAGVLPVFEQYRIFARLATRDDRSQRGFNLHELGFWSKYEWATKTEFAYLAVYDALGHTSQVVDLFETPLLKLGIAHRGARHIEISQRALSASQRVALIRILASAEDELAASARMRTTRNTLDFAARTQGPEWVEERTARFNEFRIEPQ